MTDPAGPATQAVAPANRPQRKTADPTRQARIEPLNVAKPFAHPAAPQKTEQKP